MNIAKGFAYVYTGGSPVRVVTKEFQFLGAGYIGPIPVPVILLVVVALISSLIMNKSRLGRHIYAVGGNPQAARFSGIRTENVVVKVMTVSGLLFSAGDVSSGRCWRSVMSCLVAFGRRAWVESQAFPEARHDVRRNPHPVPRILQIEGTHHRRVQPGCAA